MEILTFAIEINVKIKSEYDGKEFIRFWIVYALKRKVGYVFLSYRGRIILYACKMVAPNTDSQGIEIFKDISP